MKKNNLEADVKAYIYQAIEEIEDFLTEASDVRVEAKNVQSIISKLVQSGDLEEGFSAKHCFEFKLTEGEMTLTAYGFGDSPFEAIKIAKEKMEQQLVLIQDETITSTERNNQVNDIFSGKSTLH